MQELVSDINKCIPGPGVEPINGGRVDDPWEFSGPNSHGLSNGGETEDDLELLLHPVVEIVQQTFNHVGHTVTLSLVSDQIDQSVEILLSEQVRHPSGVEHVVDRNKESVRFDLTVSDHIDPHRGVRLCDFSVHFREEVTKVGHVEGLRDDHLLQLVANDERGQTGQGLLTGTTDSHQKGMARGKLDDTRDPADVLNSLIEQHQVHLSFHIVIFVQFFLHHSSQLSHVLSRRVKLIHESREDDGFGEGSVLFVEIANSLRHGVLEDSPEKIGIVLVDEPVLEGTTHLVHPQTQHIACGLV